MSRKTVHICAGQSMTSPDNGKLTCSLQGGINKCKLTCNSGTASQERIQCKRGYGWRPTHKLECKGSSVGVIIGVLIGGLAAVILIAIGYAKYNERKKARLAREAGETGNQEPASRPGKNLGVSNPAAHFPNVHDRPPMSSRHQAAARDWDDTKSTRSHRSHAPSVRSGIHGYDRPVPTAPVPQRTPRQNRSSGSGGQHHHQGYQMAAPAHEGYAPAPPAYSQMYQQQQHGGHGYDQGIPQYGYNQQPAAPIGYGGLHAQQDYGRPARGPYKVPI
uniref:Uncharacterized LOC100183586 n=1 Tax=Ciona intestinalis TaxID=7719 RepID=F6WN62_CIOIN|nr:uncharacterized protein LOC100183586 [Ciona intestinalis]|eukprot:XP_002130321.1 uncharacterized protein LOC100183586 [Ciona intestinalis]